MSYSGGITVLNVDDDRSLLELTREFLEREDDRFDIETATSADDGLDAIRDRRPDCIVSDYDMPGTNGIEFLRAVREDFPDIPFVLFTGKGSEAVASEAISAGVTDYLQKGTGTEQYELLANRIANAVQARRAARNATRQEELMRLTEFTGNTGGWELDLESQELLLTDGARELVGLPKEETITPAEALTLFHPDDRTDVTTAIERAAETGEQVQDVWRIQPTEGETKFIDMTVAPDASETDATTLRGAFNDITEQRNRERTLTELNRTTQRLLRADSRHDVAKIGIEAARDVLGLPANAVHFSTADGTELVPAAQTAESVSLVGTAPTLPVADSIAGRAYQRGEPIVVEDASRDPDAYNPDTSLGGHCYLPLADHGVLIAGAEKPTRFNRTKTTGGTLLAGNIVAALDRIERGDAAAEYEKRLSLFFEESPLGAIQWDEEFRFERLNQRAQEILGYSETELRGASWERIVADGDRDPVGDIVEDLLDADGGRYIINENVTRSGEIRTCEWHNRAVTDSNGDVRAIFSQFRDITERERRKRQLEEYETILTALNDAVYVVDEDGRFRYVNDAFVELVGYDRDEIIGNTPSLIKPEEGIETAERMLGRVLSSDGSETVSFEVSIQPRDGDAILCEDQMGVLPYEGDEFVGSVGTLRDITESKQRTRKLERQNDRLEEFASVVSHDLRNPLSVARGRIELAADAHDTPELTEAVDALDRSEALIEDLLTLARQGERVGEREHVDLAEIARDVWETTETEDATLVPAADRGIDADRSRLRQALENLFVNAVRHGGPGVTVTVGTMDDGFYVEDTGPGIPESRREEAFEAGFSTAETGTGFGLRIVEQVATSHGWTVEVTEGTSGGARFEFTGVEDWY